MELFNNREIAIGIWSFIILAFLTYKNKDGTIKTAIFNVLNSFFKKQIIIPLSLLIFYVLIEVFILYKINVWKLDQTKNTILWLFFVAFIQGFMTANNNIGDKLYFKNAIKDSLKLTAILEFIVAVYSFSLLAELIIVPIATIIAILLAYAETDNKYKLVENILSYLLSIIGILVLSITSHKLITEFEYVYNSKTFLDFINPILLSILFLPFVYLLGLYVVYDDLFIRLSTLSNCSDCNPKENKKVLRYAKIKSVLELNINKKLLNKWKRRLKYSDLESKINFKNALAEFKNSDFC